MTERTADAVETDYHATVNLIILLSYWLKEHPFSEVRRLVFDLSDQLGQQLANNIYELTEIADAELTELDLDEAWLDFLARVKEQREAKQGDAKDEPESEPDEEDAPGGEGGDRAIWRGWTAEDLKRAARRVAAAGFSIGDYLPITREEPSENQATEESQAEHERKREEEIHQRLRETCEEIQANPPRWSQRIAALEEWREVTDERVTLLEKETKSLRQDRSSRCFTLHHGEPRADGLWSALGVLDYADDPDEDENAAPGLRDVLERNDEIRCDTCGETILRRDDDAWSEAAAEAAIGEHMDHCKPTDPPMGLQPGPPTEPGLYLVACDPPAFSSLGLDHAWAICTADQGDLSLFRCHHPGGSTEIPSENVASHLRLPHDPAEGLPLRTGWKAGPPPADAVGTFAIKNHKGRCGLSRNNRRALAGSEEIERIVVVDAHTPSGATALWPVETVKYHARLGD